MSLVFTRLPGESYRGQLMSLLCLRDVFRTLLTYSLVYRLNMKVFLIHILGTLLTAKNFVFLTFVFLVHSHTHPPHPQLRHLDHDYSSIFDFRVYSRWITTSNVS